MALSGTTNKITFTAVGGEVSFIFPDTIPFFDTSPVTTTKYGDIKVTRERSGTLLVLTPKETFSSPAVDTEFKLVATNGDPSQGGIITLGAGATAGDKYVIERDVAYTQQYDLQDGATIDPTALNKAFDRVVAQNQQQNDLITRTVEFPVSDNPSRTYTVGTETARANKALGFDASGNVTEIDLVSSGSVSGNTNAGISISNNIISAKVDGTTTEFSGGNIAVKNEAITTNKIASDAVTYEKMQDIATSNSVLGNTATGTVAERALVGDILLDEDTMISDSAIKGATQQSIKAYIDSRNQYFHLQETVDDGNGITINANAYTKRLLGSKFNNIIGASTNNAVITLPAGTYKISGYACIKGDNAHSAPHQTSFRNTTDNTTVVQGVNAGALGMANVDSSLTNDSPIQGIFTITSSKTFELRTYKSTANNTSGGNSVGAPNEDDVYADLLIHKIG